MKKRKSKNKWQIILYVKNKKDLQKNFLAGLTGYIHHAEHLIYLFPKELAPKIGLQETTDDLQIKCFIRSGEVIAKGALLPQAAAVQVLELKDIYSRTPFKTSQLQQLANSEVALIGLGSMGASMALELARAGVGRMILIDPDIMEIANISRHE